MKIHKKPLNILFVLAFLMLCSPVTVFAPLHRAAQCAVSLSAAPVMDALLQRLIRQTGVELGRLVSQNADVSYDELYEKAQASYAKRNAHPPLGVECECGQTDFWELLRFCVEAHGVGGTQAQEKAKEILLWIEEIEMLRKGKSDE